MTNFNFKANFTLCAILVASTTLQSCKNSNNTQILTDELIKKDIMKNDSEKDNTELVAKFKEIADCKCTYYPPTSGSEFLRHYNSAIARGKQEGFVPLLVYVNDILYTAISSELGMEDENKIDIQTIRSTRKKLIAEASAEEGKKWLQKELKDLKDDSYNEILGEPVNDQQGMKELSIFSQEKTPPMLIVEVPVKEPWQVIAWFPFGNWNACPEKKDLVNVCKYWYEKYGAVPSLITYDTLEMTVSKPVSNNQSLELAEEQYAFCTDIVSQGVGYVNTLADCLRKSTVWYFWWD